MSALLALRLVTYLLVLTGVAALYGAALVGPVGAALVVLAILVGWGHEQARARGAVRAALGYGLVGAAAVAVTVDLLYLAYSVLDGMVHLLLFLILLRLFVRRGLGTCATPGCSPSSCWWPPPPSASASVSWWCS